MPVTYEFGFAEADQFPQVNVVQPTNVIGRDVEHCRLSSEPKVDFGSDLGPSLIPKADAHRNVHDRGAP